MKNILSKATFHIGAQQLHAVGLKGNLGKSD